MGKKCCVRATRRGSFRGERELCVLEHVFSIPTDCLLTLFRVSERVRFLSCGGAYYSGHVE
ncbi:Hypothetical protein FKW44_014014 [Caligus rogercresseyi]|uniref:Uncharacterized protein n=1 Tax=Caligus rogercresseyi TaxID=217165 RepID=A0A7T8GYA8_CALRO|nr:Hypothetical protein FKW44_014014 [Caligus rogercresseyi]